MKIDATKLPVINDRNGTRKVEDSTFAALADAGISNAYGLGPNDVVTFPETEADCHIKTQEMRADGPKVHLVSVIRNGRESWLGTGSLRRRSAAMTFACPFSEELATKYGDDRLRVASLLGKTIKVTGTKAMEVNEFTNDGVQTGNKIMRDFPIIEFADESEQTSAE